MKLCLPGEAARKLKPLARSAELAGTPLFIVGGCVRDWILGRDNKDWDLVAESDPAPLARSCLSRWGGRLEAFDRFGTLRLRAKDGARVDFARARRETYPAPAALPVVRPGTLDDDLRRRDFTVNAMAAAPEPDGTAEVFDPLGGARDLERGIIRVLHSASFQDDPTRLYRAARFAARFGFRLDPATERLRRRARKAGWAELLSRERLRGELLRILGEEDPVPALRLLKEWGLARVLHPRLSWPAGLRRAERVLERLGLMALRMEAVCAGSGSDLVRSLHLERSDSLALRQAFGTARRRSSPRTALPPLARSVLSLLRVARAKSALDPLLVGGADLERLGLSPGPEFQLRLERAAKAQWRGEFSTRPAALRWLKAHSR